MNPLGRTIFHRRKELKLTLQQVADRAGCTKGYLSTLENEKRSTVPSADMLRRLEKALHLENGRLVAAGEWKATPSIVRARVRELEQQTLAVKRLAEVLQRDGVDRAFKSGELAKLVRSLDGGDSASGVPAPGEASGGSEGNLRMMGVLPMQVPVINKVAAGYPTAFTDLGYPARVADEYVSVPDVYDADAFAARVVGDSMEPVYREGDIVVFSPMTATVDGSDCFVRFERNEEATFKRVYFEAASKEPPGAPPGMAPGMAPGAENAGSTDAPRTQDLPGGSAGGPGAPGGMKRIRLQPLNPAYPARVVDREEVAGLYAAVYVVRAVGKSK